MADWHRLMDHLDPLTEEEVTMTLVELEDLCGPLKQTFGRRHDYWSERHNHSWAWTACNRTAKLKRKTKSVVFTYSPPGELEPVNPANLSVSHASAFDVTWERRGRAQLRDGRLVLPSVRSGPGVYRFSVLDPQGGVRRCYIGESGFVPTRMKQYEEARKDSSLRVREWLEVHLRLEGWTVYLDTVLSVDIPH